MSTVDHPLFIKCACEKRRNASVSQSTLCISSLLLVSADIHSSTSQTEQLMERTRQIPSHLRSAAGSQSVGITSQYVKYICAPSSSVRLLMTLSASTVLSPPLSSPSTTFLGGETSSPIDDETMALREGMTTWYFGPTRVAARGKMRSSGSTIHI